MLYYACDLSDICPVDSPVYVYIFKSLNVYLNLRERDSAWAGEGQRETESEAGSRLWAVSTEPDMGLELMSCDIMTWAKAGGLTDWATKARRPPTHTHLINLD